MILIILLVWYRQLHHYQGHVVPYGHGQDDFYCQEQENGQEVEDFPVGGGGNVLGRVVTQRAREQIAKYINATVSPIMLRCS